MRHRLIVKSEMKSLDSVYLWVEEILTNEVSKKQLRNILLIVQEMVTNSILHGNQAVIEREVTVLLSINQEDITIEIEDEGEGIKTLPLKKESKELDYLAENGRGLKLAVLLTKSIELHGNRTKLIFTKN